MGVTIDPQLLTQALTHRSFAYENGGLPTNERLEFLGDSVLGLVVTDTLYQRHPELHEGQLAKLRAAVVNMRALASVARRLDLGAYLLLGRGELTTGGRDKSSILADCLEALIGATYCEHGIGAASQLVHHLIDPLLDASETMGAGLDWKTSLQELRQAIATTPATPEQLIGNVNRLRANDKAYVRVWRAEPAYEVHGEEFTDPPPSLALVLAGAQSVPLNRNSKIAEMVIDGGGMMVTGGKTVQVEVKP